MSDKKQTAINTAYFSIIGNILLAIIKATAGIFGNSYALVADAIESATDVLSSILVLIGLKIAQKPADENHPYGHGKVEALVTFMVAAFLVAAATVIIIQSIDNIRTPHDSPAAWTLIVLVLIIAWKEASYRIVLAKSRETNSSALKADAWHHRSDAISSLTALIGILVALLLGPEYANADDWAALVAAGIILYNSYLIFRPALGELLDEHFHDELIEQIREQSLVVSGIVNTEKCYVRKSGMNYLVDLHARVDGNISVRAGHDIAHQLKDHLRKELPDIQDVLIHIEPD